MKKFISQAYNSKFWVVASLVVDQLEVIVEFSNQQDAKEIWEFPKNWGTSLWVPFHKDPTISGTTFGSMKCHHVHHQLYIFLQRAVDNSSNGTTWIPQFHDFSSIPPYFCLCCIN